MNIEEYRALKAQQAKQDTEPVQPDQQEPTQTQPPATPEPTTPEPTPTEPTSPEPRKITIDGVGEVDEDELKLGYLRTQDYTRKTQEVARQRKEAEEALAFYDTVRRNPQALEALKQNTPVPTSLDPSTAKVVELESRMYDMMLQNEIMQMKMKHSDFNEIEVLQVAQEKQLTNLEDAYFLVKSRKPQEPSAPQVDQVELEKQIRAKVLAELDAERGATQTLISSNDATVSTPKVEKPLSELEKRIAKSFGMTEDEYRKNKR